MKKRAFWLSFLLLIAAFFIYFLRSYGVSWYIIAFIFVFALLAYARVRLFLRQTRRDVPEVDAYQSIEYRSPRRKSW